jgi:hypothetical protein
VAHCFTLDLLVAITLNKLGLCWLGEEPVSHNKVVLNVVPKLVPSRLATVG